MSKKRVSQGKLARLTLKERKKRAAHNERTHRDAKLWAKEHIVRQRLDPRKGKSLGERGRKQAKDA